MIRLSCYVIKLIFLSNTISKFQRRPIRFIHLIRLVSSRSRTAYWPRDFLRDPTFIFRKSCSFRGYHMEEHRETSYSRETREAGPILSSAARWKYMSAIMRQSSCLWCRKEFSPLATGENCRSPSLEAHCLRIGVISRASRIQVYSDNGFASRGNPFFFTFPYRIYFKPGKSEVFTKNDVFRNTLFTIILQMSEELRSL